jgi:hypothetical protein
VQLDLLWFNGTTLLLLLLLLSQLAVGVYCCSMLQPPHVVPAGSTSRHCMSCYCEHLSNAAAGSCKMLLLYLFCYCC